MAYLGRPVSQVNEMVPPIFSFYPSLEEPRMGREFSIEKNEMQEAVSGLDIAKSRRSD